MIGDNGKRTWVRSEEVDRVLDSFDFLTGFTIEIDELIINALCEVGFVHVSTNYLRLYREEMDLVVSKFNDKWLVWVDGVSEPILYPRAMWGDIRMAWDKYIRYRK